MSFVWKGGRRNMRRGRLRKEEMAKKGTTTEGKKEIRREEGEI